jgi:two-component system, NarL family, nitrate/nitrite response regulator NarL
MVAERPSLTPREHEILQLTADGRSAPDIARTLQVSPASVRRQLVSVFGKLGVTDRTGAVAAANRFQLLN